MGELTSFYVKSNSIPLSPCLTEQAKLMVPDVVIASVIVIISDSQLSRDRQEVLKADFSKQTISTNFFHKDNFLQTSRQVRADDERINYLEIQSLPANCRIDSTAKVHSYPAAVSGGGRSRALGRAAATRLGPPPAQRMRRARPVKALTMGERVITLVEGPIITFASVVLDTTHALMIHSSG
ncbi:hypothetical protein EVAR_82710_1 [Eumeta japonica]|uniref:Uncharacterized protein n=1 Tax=Eumeta variegata TaxID=151549 RepID=A0A4C1YBZ2_EUMVA|nr:hypothetical protein EVAR_82710_1 [Eumeta japonica]